MSCLKHNLLKQVLFQQKRKGAGEGGGGEEIVHKLPSAYLLLYTLKGFKHAHACSTHIIHCEIKMHNHTGNLLRKRYM